MGLAEGRRVPGERGDSAEQDSSFPAAEVRAALRAALSQTMEFSRLLRAPPPAQGPAEKRTHERTTPPPKGPAHSDPPVQPPSSCRVVFFFFWRQISAGLFSRVVWGFYQRSRPGVREPQGVKANPRAQAPPPRR